MKIWSVCVNSECLVREMCHNYRGIPNIPFRVIHSDRPDIQHTDDCDDFKSIPRDCDLAPYPLGDFVEEIT